jgi:hypothetical protein
MRSSSGSSRTARACRGEMPAPLSACLSSQSKRGRKSVCCRWIAEICAAPCSRTNARNIPPAATGCMQLLRVADAHQFGARVDRCLLKQSELSRANHPGFVQDKDHALAELDAAISQSEQQARDGAKTDRRHRTRARDHVTRSGDGDAVDFVVGRTSQDFAAVVGRVAFSNKRAHWFLRRLITPPILSNHLMKRKHWAKCGYLRKCVDFEAA